MFPRPPHNTEAKALAFGTISALMFAGLGRLAWRRQPAVALLTAALFGLTMIYMITHVGLRFRLPIHTLSALVACDLALAVVAALWRPGGRTWIGSGSGGTVR
jgi:glucose dehydrogenase